jgi:RNA polymerase sigma-70 factor (ECF subfamily)
VIARRICVHELTRRASIREAPKANGRAEAPARNRADASLENMEEVQKLLRKLPAREREVVRLFYLEGRSYEEISTELHIPVNTIGPVLARARKKLRDGNAPTAVKAEKDKKAGGAEM